MQPPFFAAADAKSDHFEVEETAVHVSWLGESRALE